MELPNQHHSWQSTVVDMLRIPQFSASIPSSLHVPPLSATPIPGKQNRCDQPSLGQEKDYNAHRNPIKLAPPPKAITICNSSLRLRVESLQLRALVRKWHFPEMTDGEMRAWIAEKWIPCISYVPIISRLMKDWYSFHFQTSSDLDFILQQPWVSGRSFLALTRWFLGFDPLKNIPSNYMIWAKLPNLPLELWTEETLTEIGNSIDKFVYADPWCRGEKDKRIAWILIEKPYKGAYPDYMIIDWEGSTFNQRLDFWGIPFRCSQCHRTGHLIKDCRYRPIGRTKRFHKRLENHGNCDLETDKLVNSPISLGTVILESSDHEEGHRDVTFVCSSTPEPTDNPPITSPIPKDKADFIFGSHTISVSPRSLSPSLPQADISKGKVNVPSPTPYNSPEGSPVNIPDSDLDSLLQRYPSLLEPLSIHKPTSHSFPSISPNSAKNITTRKKKKGDSRHFRGRTIGPDLEVANLSLVEIPVLDSIGSQSLRAWEADQSSKWLF